MTEREVLIERNQVSYEGVFNFQELVDLIKQNGSDRGYFAITPRHSETISEQGKYLKYNLILDQKISDYAKINVMFEIEIRDMAEKNMEIRKKKKKMQEGKLDIFYTALFVTDYEKRFDVKPLFYFVRKLFEKYVFPSTMSQYEDKAKKDTMWIVHNIKSYLNLATR